MWLPASIRICLFGPLLCFLLFSQFATAQKGVSDEKKLARKAVVLVQNKKLEAALPLFKRLYKLNPENPAYNYYLGFIYLSIATDKSVALPYLQTAYEHKNDWPRVIRYLARANHLLYQFDEAVKFYEEYMARLPTVELKNSIKHKIQKCHTGKLLVQDTIKSEISNLGNKINTIYPDYAPIISSDDRLLIFTSRRPTTTGGGKDFDQLFFEDIYMSVKKKGVWQTATDVGENVNTPLHDASIGLSADAQQMLIYHEENIYITTLEGDVWSVPKKVGSNINTKSWETHACISLDQQVLYFTSDREGGYGGMDIYKALKLPNGKWALVQNLGPVINTPYDEKAPFIHPADKTLYFSSNGHYNMGGFDIFKSSFIKNQWTTPKNLGHPINTPGDDLFFVVSANGKHTYFSSDLRENNLGGQDIYQLTMPDTGRVKIAIIKGRIYGKDQQPISASFLVSDAETNKVVGVFNSNASTGKYLLVFPAGKSYNMVVKAKGFIPHRESFTIPEQEYVFNMFQEISFTHLSRNDSVLGQKIVFRNSFCDIETAVKADSSLNDDLSEESTFSQFLRNLENPEKRESLLAKVKGLDSTASPDIYRCMYDYLPTSQIHLFDSANTNSLEATIIEFEKDTVVLNMDTIFKKETIYTTSSSSATIVQLAALDTSINIVLEEFEKAIKSSENLTEAAVPSMEAVPDGEPESAIDPIVSDSSRDGSEPVVDPATTRPARMKEEPQNILFEFDSSSLPAGATGKLDKLIERMKSNNSFTAAINGHTDHKGPTAYNKTLSLRRANAVAGYIKSNGIAEDRLVINAYGESRPIAPNVHPDGSDNPGGRRKNRRTEIRLVH